MGKSHPRIGISLVLAAVFCSAAGAQAVVEYGTAAGASANGAAQLQKTGKQIGGVWNSLSKTLQASPDQPGSQSPAPPRTARRASVRSNKAPAPASTPAAETHEDSSSIQPGLAYDELIRRFGAPSFEVTTSPRTKALAYSGKNGTVDIDVQDEQVIKVAAATLQEAEVVAPK